MTKKRAPKCVQIIGNPYNIKETVWWCLKHIIMDLYWPITIIIIAIYLNKLFFSFQIGLDIIFFIPWLLNTFLCIAFLFIGLAIIRFIKIHLNKAENIKNTGNGPWFSNKLNKLESRKNNFIIGFIGDIMPLNKYNITFHCNVRNFFADVDLIIGNMEGVITSFKKIGIGIKRHDYKILDYLKKLKNDPEKWLICVSNNHSGDLGIRGFRETVDIVNKNNFNKFGEEDNPYFIKDININGNRHQINIVSGTMWSNHRRCRFITRFQCNQYNYRENMFNLLFPHWHYENEAYVRKSIQDKSQNLIKYGKYKRTREIKKYYREVPSKPWDLIVGHHSHVPQPITKVEQKGNPNKLIAYSGGNFTSGENRKKHRHGLIVKCEIGLWKENPNKLAIGNVHWAYTYNKNLKRKQKGKTRKITIYHHLRPNIRNSFTGFSNYLKLRVLVRNYILIIFILLLLIALFIYFS